MWAEPARHFSTTWDEISNAGCRAGLALVVAGLAVGIGGSVLSMARIFVAVKGLSEPERARLLAEGVRAKLIFTGVGGGLFLIGAVLAAGALYVHFETKPRGE